MNQIRLPTLSLSELLVRRKYQNVNHLLTSRNTYYNHKTGNFDFQGDVLGNSTATMAFRVLQFQANWSFIEGLCVTYVYDSKYSKFDKREMKIRSQILATEKYMLKKYQLIESLMGTPLEKNAERYFSGTKNWRGYQTYGDPERLLALYLSPFCSFQQFVNCLNIIEEKLKMASRIHEPWKGLFNHLEVNAITHFKELEKITKGNLASENKAV